MKKGEGLTEEEYNECVASSLKKGWIVLDRVDETGMKYYNLTPLGKAVAELEKEAEKLK